MPLQHWNKEVGIQSYHPEAIVHALNEIIDYCNELERRLAELEKKPSYSGQVIYPSNATPPCTCSVTTVGHQPNCPRNPKNWKVTS